MTKPHIHFLHRNADGDNHMIKSTTDKRARLRRGMQRCYAGKGEASSAVIVSPWIISSQQTRNVTCHHLLWAGAVWTRLCDCRNLGLLLTLLAWTTNSLFTDCTPCHASWLMTRRTRTTQNTGTLRTAASASATTAGSLLLYLFFLELVRQLGDWRVKRPGRKFDHSPPPTIEIKNAWIHTSTSGCTFMAWCLIKCTDNLNSTDVYDIFINDRSSRVYCFSGQQWIWNGTDRRM
jgi:hypothetical protein